MKHIALASVALALSACAHAPSGDTQFASCPAYKPAYDVTDRFMETFNSKDADLYVTTFHLPSVRIASGEVRIIEGAADLAPSFERLAATGWDHSAWADRRVVQCGSDKAHMLTTFVRYRADGSELSRFNSLYIVENKNGRWALTARSSFAP